MYAWEKEELGGPGTSGLRRVLFQLSLGHCQSSPFPEAVVAKVREKWLHILSSEGLYLSITSEVREQPIDVILLK